MQNFREKIKKLTLLATFLIGLGISNHAYSQRGIGEYVPTYTGPETAESTLDCNEQGYHEYTFSVHDENPPNAPYDGYYSVITYLKINLHEDFVENVNMNNLLCSTPWTDSEDIYIDCNGGSYTRTTGGINLKTEADVFYNGDGTAYVKWTYSDPNPNDGTPSTKPWMTTIAGYDDWFSASVSFYGNANVDETDTATTDSYLYRHVYGVNVNNDETWTYTDIPDNILLGFNNDTWYTDGDIAISYFTPCEEEQHYCADMTLHSPASVISEVDARDTIIIDISTVDENNHTWDEDDDGFYGYKYWALNYNNQTAGGKFFTSAWDFFGDTILYTDESDTVRYKNGAPGDQIFVCAVDQNNNCIQACQVEIESPICTDLDLNPSTITAGEIPYSIPFTITAQDSYGGAWDGIAIWDTSNPTGIFSDNNTHTNNVTVTYSDNQQAATISVEDNEFPQYCADSATINFEPQLACWYLEIIEPQDYTEDLYPGCFDIKIEAYNTDLSQRGSVICYEAFDFQSGLPATGAFTDIYGVTQQGQLCTTSQEVEYCGGSYDDAIYIYDFFEEQACNARLIPESEQVICEELNIVAPQADTLSDLGETYFFDITIETYGTDGNPWIGTANWDTTSASAGFSPSDTSSTFATVNYIENLHAEGATYTVTVADSQYPMICNDELTITRGDVPVDDIDDIDDIDSVVDSVDSIDSVDSVFDDVDSIVDSVDNVDNVDNVFDSIDDVTDSIDDYYGEEYNPGTLTKDASSYNFTTDADGSTGQYLKMDSAVLAHDEDYLFYSLTYTSADADTAIITDTLENIIYGYDSNGATLSSYLYYDTGSFTIDVPQCTDESVDVCYNLLYSNPLEGIELLNLSENDRVEMTYTARVESNLNCDNQQLDVCLAEYFTNEAEADEFRQGTFLATLYADSTVTVICPYLLTRNAGDVYLEGTLSSGTSIACVAENNFKNTDGLAMISQIGFTLEQALNNFSSYVLDLFYTTKNIWEIAQIEDTTKSHISRATYNYNIATPLTGPANIWNWSDLEQYENLNNPEENIYYLNQTLNINGPITIPQGAHTVIVENGNLNIGAYANIRYEDAQFGFNHYTYKDDADYQNLASVAFVVLNGNININHSVSDMVGVYYVDNGGLYNSGAERDPIGEQLRIYGSVYGDIENLMAESGFVGPPELDHGAIVIRYDERVILNTPPGLSEYVDFYSEKVAR